MTRHKGYRSKTRRLFRKDVRSRGLCGLSRFMVDFKEGDRVDIIPDPFFQKRGLPHRHFHGFTGKVLGARGRCYEVQVADQGGKLKTLFLGREHIRINKSFLMEQEAAAKQAESK